jgi:hypothetical protein
MNVPFVDILVKVYHTKARHALVNFFNPPRIGSNLRDGEYYNDSEREIIKNSRS